MIARLILRLALVVLVAGLLPSAVQAKSIFCDGFETIDAPQAGDLLITELQGNPQGIADSAGEYVEILSLANAPLALTGLVVAYTSAPGILPVNSTSVFALEGCFVLDPGQHALLASSSDPAGDGSLVPDAIYDGIEMSNNSADSVRIRLLGPSFPGGEETLFVIDQIVTSSGAFDNTLRGQAWQLDPASLSAPPDASDNDSFESFCLTSTLPEFEYVTGNWGTPRKANDC